MRSGLSEGNISTTTHYLFILFPATRAPRGGSANWEAPSVLFLGLRPPPPRAFNWLASLLEAWSRPHLRPLPLPTWPGRWRLMRSLPGVKAFSLGSVNPCASLSEWATFCMFSPGSYFSEFLFSEPKLGCMA